MSIKTLLNNEIKDQIEEVGKMEVGTDTYKTAVDGLTKLMDKAIEMDKVENERKDRITTQSIETDLKLKQMEDERKDRIVRNSITAAGIAIPSLITIWGTIKSIKFEETGTITTIMGRGFINKLLPKK